MISDLNKQQKKEIYLKFLKTKMAKKMTPFAKGILQGRFIENKTYKELAISYNLSDSRIKQLLDKYLLRISLYLRKIPVYVIVGKTMEERPYTFVNNGLIEKNYLVIE